MFSLILFGIALAQPENGMQDSDNQKFGNFKVGKCEDQCVTFVQCLFDTKGNYTEGHNQVKARDLTWDCLWSIDDTWVVEKNLRDATKCSMKVYENSDQDDVEDCYADNIYSPAWGMVIGGMFFQFIIGVAGLGSLIAISCAHCRCYKPPQNLTGTGFCCCKFWCPLAAVISSDRYQDSTALAALFSWCGCIYTFCCWQPKPVELYVGQANQYNQMPANGAPNQSRNVNWGV